MWAKLKSNGFAQAASLGVLMVIPKCSLCLFTVTSAITVCGVAPVVPPTWEYLLIGFFGLLQLGLVMYEIRKGFYMLSIVLSITGVLSLAGFLLLNLSTWSYYVGVGLLLLSWFTLRWYAVRNKRDCCADTKKMVLPA